MRRGELAGNLILPGLAVLGACVVSTPLNIGIVCLCYTFGVAAMIKAKWPLFQRGVWTSFGPSRLSPQRRRIYWTGYALIAIGIVLNLMVLAILERHR